MRRAQSANDVRGDATAAEAQLSRFDRAQQTLQRFPAQHRSDSARVALPTTLVAQEQPIGRARSRLAQASRKHGKSTQAHRHSLPLPRAPLHDRTKVRSVAETRASRTTLRASRCETRLMPTPAIVARRAQQFAVPAPSRARHQMAQEGAPRHPPVMCTAANPRHRERDRQHVMTFRAVSLRRDIRTVRSSRARRRSASAAQSVVRRGHRTPRIAPPKHEPRLLRSNQRPFREIVHRAL